MNTDEINPSLEKSSNSKTILNSETPIEELNILLTPPNKIILKNLSNIYQSTSMETENLKIYENAATIEGNSDAEFKSNNTLISQDYKDSEISHKKITEFYLTSVKKNEFESKIKDKNNKIYLDKNQEDEEKGYNESFINSTKKIKNENEDYFYSDENDSLKSKSDSKLNSEIKNNPLISNNKELNKKLAKKNLKSKYKENIKRFFFNQESKIDNNEIEDLKSFKENNENYNSDNKNDFNSNLFENTAVPLGTAFLGLKRLRKKADILKEKAAVKKLSAAMFEDEAELGSDNEEHDDIIKKINPEESNEDEDSDLDENLPDLINDQELPNEYEYSEELKEKFFKEMLQKDREDIKRVIQGPEEQRKKLMRKELIDISDLPLSERIRKLKSENEGNSEVFFSDLIFKSKNNFSKNNSSNSLPVENSENVFGENEDDDELKKLVEQHENNRIKKFSDESKLNKQFLINRKQENQKILEHVIDLNSDCYKNSMLKNEEEKKSNKELNFFVKGNLPSLNQRKNENSFKLPSFNSINNDNKNSLAFKYGNFFDKKNSVLHAMKNDKYFNKNELEELKIDEFNKKTTNNILNKEKLAAGFSAMVGGLSKTKSKATNLSALFKSNGPIRGNIVNFEEKANESFKNDGKNSDKQESFSLLKNKQ